MKRMKWIPLLLVFCLLFQAAALADAPAPTEGITVPVMEGMKDFEVPENDALALVRDMKCGWNLGNTFDAINGNGHDTTTQLEYWWLGGPGKITTKALLEALKEAGFNSIRIPVSWHNHVDNDFNIDAAWMDRVREVASWAMDLGMYAIVNIHHDNDAAFFYPDRAHAERTDAYLTAIWTQMAENFKDFGDHLILESMNEPRLVGTSFEWNWNENDPTCIEAAERINELNQMFVNIIRASGGNNADRYLSIPAYAASPWNTVKDAFRLPEDTADNRIIVAAHAYTPYDFALNTNSTDKTFDLDADNSKKAEISGFLNGLYERFVVNGVPVIMDEFGAINKSNLQDRVNFTAYYVASASTRGITCFWWDNGAFTGNGELFGLIDRGTQEWRFPDIVLAIMANCLYQR